MKYSSLFFVPSVTRIARALILIFVLSMIAMVAFSQSFVTELNSHRTHKLEVRKSKAAKKWCELMAKNDGFSHDRLALPSNQDEIILRNNTGEDDCYEQWFASPPHRKAMLNEQYDYIAFYIVKNRGMYYAVARLWKK